MAAIAYPILVLRLTKILSWDFFFSSSYGAIAKMNRLNIPYIDPILAGDRPQNLVSKHPIDNDRINPSQLWN